MWRKGSLTIFNYHRIGDARDTRFDDAVFTATAETFERGVRRLKKESDVLSEDDLLAVVENRSRLPRRASAITFDDGYRDNYTIAYPILRAAGVPAMFFIPTRSLTERSLGWWDTIAYLIKQRGGSAREIRAIQEAAKVERRRTIDEMVDELAARLGVALPPRRAQSAELLTWAQVRELSRAPFAVGSHTHTHRILSSLDVDEQRDELTRSKTILERKLEKPVRSLAYPVGGHRHFDFDTKRLAREASYRMGFSFLTGMRFSENTDPWDVPRRDPSPRSPMRAAARAVLSRVPFRRWRAALNDLG